MGFDPSKWNFVQHLAVWPLLALVVFIAWGFIWLSISDPTLPDDGKPKQNKTEDVTEKEQPATQGADSAAPRHRA